MEDEERLGAAAMHDKVDAVKDLLRGNPSLNVNWKDGSGWTALHTACSKGHDSIVALLLAHPAIDLNPQDNLGQTPFWGACYYGSSECARILIRDTRARVNDPDEGGQTPFRWAAFRGHLDIILWLLASGRDLDLGSPGNDKTDAIGEAKKAGNTAVASLLERFKNDQAQTRHEVRRKLGITGEC